MPIMMRRRTAMMAGLAAAGAAPALQAQERFPARPIEFLVPWGPGGGADQLARKIAKLIEPELKVSVPVLNIAGATGNTGMTKLLSGASDGHAMAVLIADTLATLATGGGRWKLADIEPIGIMVRQPSGFFIRQDSRFASWSDIAAEAKAKPGTLKVAILGFGSVDDMTLGYLANQGLRFVGVPFANPGERYTSILGGHADILFEQAGDIRSFLDSRQMRPILFFNAERLREFPDIPCSKEVGAEIFLPQFRSLVIKSGVDPERAKRLAAAIAKAAADPEYVAFLKDSLAAGDSFIPAEAAGRFLDGELEAMRKAAQLIRR
jgi:tripartite-type tricarboxylate transporter receptor subunit TctC